MKSLGPNLRWLALLLVLLGGSLFVVFGNGIGGAHAAPGPAGPLNTATISATTTGTPNTPTNTRTATMTRSATITRTPANTRTPTPTPGCNDWRRKVCPTGGELINPLYGVASASPNDVWAVGFRSEYGSVDPKVLIERWDGNEWSLLPVTNTGVLRGVDVVAPDDVWAVGYTDESVARTMTMHWNGTAWSIVPSPSVAGVPNHLYGVAAAGPNDVWAVGHAGDQALALRWDGTQWNTVTTPALDYSLLNGVAVAGANDVWAVGSEGYDNRRTLVLRWDGSAWARSPSPNPSTFRNSLQAISIASANDIWAAGWTIDNEHSGFIMHWDGSQWAISPIAEPAGPSNPDNEYEEFYGITAASSTEAWAVGWVGARRNVIVRWDGTTWTRIYVASTSSYFSELFGVANVAPGEAWAVGLLGREGSGYYDPQILRYGPACGTPTPTLTGTPPTATSTRTPTPTRTTTGTPAITPTPCSLATLTGSLVDADPDFARPAEFLQGGSCTTGASHNYDAYELFQGTAGTVTVSTCGGAAWDTFLVIYQAPGGERIPNFVPNSCNLAIAADDDGCGILSRVSADLSAGYFYVVVSEFLAPGGAYTVQVTGNAGCGTPPASPTPSPQPGTTTPVPPTSTGTAAASPTPSEEPSTSTPTPVPTALACEMTYSDLGTGNAFYNQIMCLSCMGFMSGYSDGTFRPSSNLTRGQLAKIVANTAGFGDPETNAQTFQDVLPGSPYHMYIERIAGRGIISGYACGGRDEPCDAQNRPYFRPGAYVTRGQVSKILSNAAGYSGPAVGQGYSDVPSSSPFYAEIMRLSSHGVMGGYTCGGVNPQTGQPEPCDPENRPYFRPFNNVTRGQASKMVANTFYPGCQMAAR
jgi:hypothetical protein